MKSDHFIQLIAITMIALSGFHCIFGMIPKKDFLKCSSRKVLTNVETLIPNRFDAAFVPRKMKGFVVVGKAVTPDGRESEVICNVWRPKKVVVCDAPQIPPEPEMNVFFTVVRS
jgi:hypothetical protein